MSNVLPVPEQQQHNKKGVPSRDDELFRKYYDQYRMRVYWYIYRKISHSEESEDLTADVFLKLYEHIDQIGKRGKSGVLAWLYTVSRNASIDYLRKKGRKESHSIEDDEVDSTNKVYIDFVESAMSEERMRQAKVVLASIDEIGQEIMRLRYEEQMKFSQISEIVQKSEGACKMILYRNLQVVRQELERLESEGKNENQHANQDTDENVDQSDNNEQQPNATTTE